MSGRASGRGGERGTPDGGRADAARRAGPRAKLPLLDRLMDDSPAEPRDPPMSATEALAALRLSVRRDLEALLNARRRWRSWPTELRELAASPIGYGIPDFTSGAMNEAGRRETLRAEVEATIRRFEPRMVTVKVSLIESTDKLDATLRLRIDGLLHADPAPEPVAFDTMVDSTTADVYVTARNDV
ncbi:MAG: type VI secretion system baseplate subunit TssE [Rhodospirillales bacterium]|nr:type VI secretion system baseplate subunit TssE [Rhodospirillales bacterium]